MGLASLHFSYQRIRRSHAIRIRLEKDLEAICSHAGEQTGEQLFGEISFVF
jgi:hypothetical protein